MSVITRALPALILTLALITSGCGTDDSNGVASASGSSPDADSSESSGTKPGDDVDEQMLKYAQCLRDHGVEVEDPAPGQGIQLSAKSAEEQRINDEAVKACKDLAPPPPADAPSAEEEREQMLDYAECMRAEGVEAFKDPKSGEGINIGPETAEDPDFEAAEKTCNERIMGGQPDANQDVS